ncbi:MAG: type II secretion system F family protein [Proteobacteria bacterium]|nr:type II secretion system F family protein [Pseudomonadota bacterium]MBU1449463.1 type II secretion system F family protein [Pseudomonadota bacterium]MBU2468787.1 type II secretion system F family protein [Pseudomonadota bacterium]MBU2516580.1 type II secretion system F family protein [Pseudomonadota bacterium]
MIWGFTAIIFVALLAAAWALFRLLYAGQVARETATQRRLEAIAPGEAAMQAAIKSYFRDRSYSSIPYLDRLLSHLPNIADLELLIHQAGSPCNLGTLVLMSGVLASLGLLGGGLLEGSLVGSLLLLVGCGALPLMWLRFLRKRRLAAFEEQFVEAVDLIARALRAGHSFGSGLKMASQELNDPVAEELSRTFEDYSYGKGLDDALADLTRRVGLQDVKFFATAVALQREIGGNLTEILDNIGHIIRARFALLRQVKALSAEGRISAYILCLMAPGLLGALWFLSPNYLGILFEHPMGKTLLMVGGCFQGLGILVIRKLINLKV